MLKGTDLIGLPVTASGSGQILATTQDIIVSPEYDRLVGLLVNRGGWSGRARVVTWDEIVVEELNAIIVRSEQSIVDAKDVPELERVLESDRQLRGTRMCTTDGVDLGVVLDLIFSRKTGATEGYEVCGRLLDEASSHCVFVPASYRLKVEGNIAWAPPAVADLVRQQIENARRFRLPASNYRTEHRTAQDLRDSALVNMADMARGHQLLWDIRSENGRLVAVRGQPITDTVIERAIAYDRLRELLRAVDIAWFEHRDTG